MFRGYTYGALFEAANRRQAQALGLEDEGPSIVSSPTNHELRPPGLETRIIDTFPMFHYSRSDQATSSKITEECAVCLGAFEENETLRKLPKCGHVFHAACVDVWLQIRATCPFCRAILTPDNEVAGPSEERVLVVTLDYNRESGSIVVVEANYE